MLKFANIALGTSLIGLSVFSVSGSAQALTTVDRQLQLLVDGSGSINDTDFGLQLDAYYSIFADPNFFKTYVEPLPNKQIAVGSTQFGSNVSEIAPQTLIASQEDATAFANFFKNVTKDDGLTNMTAAIKEGTKVLTTNTEFEGFKTIDISTDGVPTNQTTATQASIDSIASGVNVINAIGVGSGVDFDYLETDIARGTNANGSKAFVLEAETFEDFQNSLKEKFVKEILPPPAIPEPTTIVGLLTMSFFAVGSKLKRKQKA